MKNFIRFAKTGLQLGVALLVSISAAPLAQAEEALKVGDKAPAITGKDQNDKVWKLEENLKNKVALLYFYPKDDTPGCTKQACGLRDRMGDLKTQGVEVIGVSMDTSESHRKFIEKYSLNFNLLADADGKITEKYGAKMTGRNLSRRISFLIGKDGKIIHITDNPSADKHLEEMKLAIEKLKS